MHLIIICDFQTQMLLYLCFHLFKNLNKANYSVGCPGNKLEALKHFHYGD